MKIMERPSAQDSGQEHNVMKVERFLANTAARQRATGVPVGDDGRIDMTLYKGFYSAAAIEKDLQRNREWEAEWSGGRPEEEMRKERRLRDGEQLEMLACAIFGKNLGEQFIVVRTSPHDDRANKADIVILDQKTGSLVCAFDEVGDASGPIYEEKQTLVRDRNFAGGVSLKYGIGVRMEQGRKEIVPSAAEHLPLFYIAVPSDRIRKGMKEFIADPVQQSEFEERLFSYFLATISAQIGALELYQARLDPELKKKLGAFKDVISSFNAKKQRETGAVKK